MPRCWKEEFVRPWIQEEQSSFHSGCGTLDQFKRIIEVDCPTLYMCFVNMEKALDNIPQSILMGCFGSMGWPARCYDLCTMFPLDVGLHQGCPLSLIFHDGFLGIASWWKGSTLVASESHLYSLQMMWFCCLHQVVDSSSLWSTSQPSVKQKE